MAVNSEFEDFYLIRPAFLPIICFGLGFLFLYQTWTTEGNFLTLALCLFVFGIILLYLNFKSVFKIAVEETKITKIMFLNGKKYFIPYSDIQESKLEHVHGMRSKAGDITLGYYRCVFKLKNGEVFILSPVHFKNYREIVKAISANRSIS